MSGFLKFLGRWSVRIPLAAVALAAMAWGPYRLLTRPPPGQASPDRPAGAASVPEVRTAAVESRTVTDRAELPASLSALNQATLFAKVSGYLSEISVDKGDWVKAGTPLAKLYAPEQEQAVLSAEAEVQAAEAALAKARQAVIEAELSTKELDLSISEAENARAAAEIAVKQAEAAVTEGKSAVDAAVADAKLQALTLERIASLAAGGSATPQEKDQQEGKKAMADAAVKLAEARLATTRLKVDAARSDLDRAATRVALATAKRATAASLVESARSVVKSAEAKLRLAGSARDAAKAVRDYAVIRAPYDGVIVARHVDPGAMIQSAAASQTQAAALVTIAAMDRLRVGVYVPERDVANVREGSECVLEVDALPGRKFPAKVVRVTRSVDPRTRTMLAEAEVENPRSGPSDRPAFLLYPGMYGRLTLGLATYRDARTVPADALAVEGKRTFVYALRDGAVRKVPVTVGLDDGVTVQIKDAPDLRPGDRVVIGDKGGLADGRAVRASDPAPEPAATAKR
jgi:RND family efflux transporter MFP subunit